MVVKWHLLVSDFHSDVSVVIPRSRSAFGLSRTHAYLNEPLPSCRDFFSNFSIVRSAAALVDQAAHCRRFPVDVTDDNDVSVRERPYSRNSSFSPVGNFM